MNKTGKYLVFIALVVIIGLVIPGCLSDPDSPTGTLPTGAGGGSSQPRAGGSSSQTAARQPARGGTQARTPAATRQTAQAGGSSSQAQAAVSSPARAVEARLIAAEQKAWSKFTGFLEKNWISLLIILIICAVCTIACLKVKRKGKKAIITKSVIILVSLGLIFCVSYFGMMRHDGNFQRFKWEQIFKRAASKNNEARTTHAYVNVYRLNFRAGPSISHRIVRVLRRDMRIEVINNSGLWWKVKYDNIEGYVNSRYLRRE